MKTTICLMVAMCVAMAFGYETPNGARYPYVSTYYVEPVVSPASNTVVRFFVTDWENSLERFGDGSFRFDAHLRYTTNRVDWTELSLADIPSGDHAIELGRLPRGDYVFGLRVVDRKSGLPSHTVWHEFRSRTDEELAVPADRVYTMTAADLTTYGIVPETNRYRYVEVQIDSVMATNETARQNYLAEVARTAEVASGTYAIFSPVYNGKPVLRAFRSMACKYAADYDFAAVELEASNNVIAIQRLIDAVKAAGYRRLVFLPGKYRLSYHASLEMPSGLDVDLNGATWKGNGFTGSSGCLVNFTHVHDGALRNGTIEGDYYEHDYAGSPDNSEWALGVCLHGDCRYVTLDGLVVSNITGYGVSNGTRAYDHTFTGSASFNGNGRYSPGCLNLADGTVDTAATNRFTSDFRDISKLTNGYVTVSKYLGYQGVATKSWNYVACFYDAGQAFISGEVAFQYREVLIPPGAKYMRISVEEETAAAADGCSMSAQLFKRPWNCAFRNLTIYRCRCVGMAQSAMRNMLVENCEFSFSGESSATCAYDAEDGWDMMQDVFIRNNYFHDNWNAEFLTCAGHNFVVERNRGKIHLYARTNSPCVRDNVCPSATFECGTRNRTMHGRYHGNVIEKSLNFGNDKTEQSWFINYSEPLGPETSTSAAPYPFGLNVTRTGRFRGATIRNTKMQPGAVCFEQTVFTNCHLVLSGTDGNWTDCTFKNCYWQYSKANVFTRCAFVEGTHASGMTGGGSTTMTDCVFTNFYLGSGYWTKPYDLTMKGCSVKNTITDHFWSVGVYSLANFEISDSVFDTGGVAPFHIFDLRAQDTDNEPARVSVEHSDVASGVFISKNEGGVKSTTKQVAFWSKENTVGGDPVTKVEEFMCPLLPGLWTCNFFQPPTVVGASKPGVDYNGSTVSFDVSQLTFGPYGFGDLVATLDVNGKTYAGEVTATGETDCRVSFAVDAAGANAVVASNRYDASFALWLENGTDGRTDLARVCERLIQGVPVEGLLDWFVETPQSSGADGDWTLGALPVVPATDETEEHLVVETPTGVPLVYTPKREMPEERRGVIETTLLFTEASEEDEDERPPEDARCAARIVGDEDVGYRLQVYAAAPDDAGGTTARWQDGDTAEAAGFAFVKGAEYTIRFELDCRADGESGEAVGLSCFARSSGGEYVKLFAGEALRPAGGTEERRIRNFSLLGRGKIARLNGAYQAEVVDASLAESEGVRYATVADAVAAGGQVTLLWDASWTPTENGDYSFVSNGHELKIGGDLVFKVTKSADGTLSVTVGGTVEEPKPTTIALKDGKVVIGVANPDPKRRYALARVEKLGDEFVTDESTRKTGAELLSGTSLEASVKPGATAEFFKVVVE